MKEKLIMDIINGCYYFIINTIIFRTYYVFKIDSEKKKQKILYNMNNLRKKNILLHILITKRDMKIKNEKIKRKKIEKCVITNLIKSLIKLILEQNFILKSTIICQRFSLIYKHGFDIYYLNKSYKI